ncbi:class I SAM-dependent methyltransferase [Diaphorobacter sp. MNS-0]|uniref:class I SAM-dependent methyltransferase n=1 Tax=Diaphorobacter sp. MNS-0 TaxID=2866628 RepID=UPI001C72E1F1|nr:class I SAM-dependent methyltransferase [Diaphorobacter sp. MNS-0]QYY25295.1 class I SAM-dependent methyltransferase [Diaphorobacter sp. MNS-0]
MDVIYHPQLDLLQTCTRRTDLVKLLPPGAIGIELGVAEGKFSTDLLHTGVFEHLYSVDMWRGDRGHDVEQYKLALRRLSKFRSQSTALRMTFDEAVDLFPNHFFDFIYVDGYAHTGEEDGQTFRTWWPKLKPGGVMAGDDYSSHWPRVVQAVDRFIADYTLELGVLEFEKTDDMWSQYPSWVTVKPLPAPDPSSQIALVERLAHTAYVTGELQKACKDKSFGLASSLLAQIDTSILPHPTGSLDAIRNQLALLAQPSSAVPLPQDTNHAPLANGIVLAVNCVPSAVDASVTAFWEQLGDALDSAGFMLVVLSTAKLRSDRLHVIPIAYELTRLAALDGYPCDPPPQADSAAERDLLALLGSWYRCDEATASRTLARARRFFDDLLRTLKPASVLAWQSSNPISKIIELVCRRDDIPLWFGERGWLAQTLMFDVVGNNYLSETTCSLLAQKLWQTYTPDAAQWDALEKRAVQRRAKSRYASKSFIDRTAFRERYGIPEDQRVIAWFPHGEPNLYRRGEANVLGSTHGSSRATLQNQLTEIAQYCIAHDVRLIVQDHPFNQREGERFRYPRHPNIQHVDEDVGSVLEAADHYLFTLTTIQYDAALGAKSFGLLAKTPLSVANGPYRHADYASTEAFLNALLSARDWQSRTTEIRRRIAYLNEYFLLDVHGTDALGASAQRLAQVLTSFTRPVDAQMPARVEAFLGAWQGVAA